MTIRELAQWLNVSRGQVYRLMAAGLPWFDLGDRRFDRDAVLRWLQSRKAGA